MSERGQPTLYREEYCEKLIKHMSQGYSYETFATEVKCGRSTLYEWEKHHKEWVEAKQLGQAEAQKFFESRLMAKLSGATELLKKQGINVKDIDTSCVIFALKTRFHKTYGDKQENKVDANINITIDDQDSEL